MAPALRISLSLWVGVTTGVMARLYALRPCGFGVADLVIIIMAGVCFLCNIWLLSARRGLCQSLSIEQIV